MKEQIISLSKDKGFISRIIDKSVNAKYSKKDFYYLWMCELQKWLRDLFNIIVKIKDWEGEKWYWEVVPVDRDLYERPKQTGWTWEELEFNNYEEALEKGLYEALQLI